MTFDNKGTNKGIKLYKPKFFDKNHCISIWYAFDSDPAQAPKTEPSRNARFSFFSFSKISFLK